MIRKILLAVLAMVAVGFGNELIAKDSCGIIVELREKYGPAIIDTGTMIMTYNNFFVIVHRDFPSTFYPIANYSVSKITKKECGE
jgi:hypothetical protein